MGRASSASIGRRRARCFFSAAVPAALAILLSFVALAAYMPDAAAQSSRSKPPPAPAADLRSVYATAADVAEGKRIAETTCSRCHGLAGVSGTRGVPHIAGQRPAYLHAKLRAYQAGTRGGHEMEPAVKYLNDDALVKVAAYYGSLEPAQPTAAEAKKPPPPVHDAVAAGKASAAACAGCHGETGITAMPGTPSLVGLDPKYFVNAMTAYKSGQRKNDMMQPLAASLSETDLKNLALYYALQKAGRAATPAAGDQAAGKAAASACAGCHGDAGVSATAGTPSLAGQDAQYHVAALHAYKDGARKEETMKGIASGLSEPQMKAIAAYYAAQEPRAPQVDKPLTLPEWVQRCDRCHGVNGNSADPRTPALAGQRVEYLEKALRAYQSGVRKDSVMAAMSATLSDADMQALSAYYSRQRARAFVYVTVPAR
jgi:cytochrome c553